MWGAGRDVGRDWGLWGRDLGVFGGSLFGGVVWGSLGGGIWGVFIWGGDLGVFGAHHHVGVVHQRVEKVGGLHQGEPPVAQGDHTAVSSDTWGGKCEGGDPKMGPGTPKMRGGVRK